MAESPLIAGVELGGTKVVCLLARGPDEVVEQTRIDTTTADATLAAVADVLADMRRRHGFAAIGLGGFGPLELDPASPAHGHVLATPKPGWEGADLLAMARVFDVPVGLGTDVNGAALAEGRWGAARDLSSFAYITVGTGVGVGVITAGRPLRGLGHCEAGHLRVPRRADDRFPGVCPFHGDCVEGLASGPAVAACAGAPAETLAVDHPAWDQAVQALAGLCHNLICTVSPQRILLGGGVGMGQPHLLPRLRRAVMDSLGGYAVAARIERDIDAYLVHPALGARAGPLGAVALGLDALRVS
ncbi:MAG: ROK family protein [Caulobacterales bacterium]|nr:ROK family protein [Caulobacterales bacterium]